MHCCSTKPAAVSEPAPDKVVFPTLLSSRPVNELGLASSKPAAHGLDANAVATEDRGLLEIALIFKGIVEGFAGKALPELAVLPIEAKKALEHFQSAMQDFAEWTPLSAVEALGELAKALKVLAGALSGVAAAEAQVKQLAVIISKLSEPEYVVFRAGTELLVDGKDVLKHVECAQSAFNAQQWEAFGKEIGALVAELVLPNTLMPLVENAVRDFRAQNWEAFGDDVRAILHKVCAPLSLAACPSPSCPFNACCHGSAEHDTSELTVSSV